MGLTRSKVFRAVAVTVGAMIALRCLFALFLSRKQVGTNEERFFCTWEDGTTTEEDFSDTYTALYGNEGSDVALAQDGLMGKIEGSSAFQRILSVVESGTLADLLTLEGTDDRMEQAALARLLSGKLWVADGEAFRYDGRFSPSDFCPAEEIILLSGEITAEQVQKIGATRLDLRASAQVSFASFVGTAICEVKASPPYLFEDGALYSRSESGRRLISALPDAVSLTLDYAYIDEGALVPCKFVTSLDLPFIGSATSDMAAGFDGGLTYLFSAGSAHFFPSTLQTVRVRGGSLVAHAFYQFVALTEIDACGVDPSKIAQNAFIDCPNLVLLHSPRADVVLSGQFTSYLAECGCTVYEGKIS